MRSCFLAELDLIVSDEFVHDLDLVLLSAESKRTSEKREIYYSRAELKLPVYLGSMNLIIF